MRIALYTPANMPESFRVYSENVAEALRELGCVVMHFDALDEIPDDADVIWDPRSGGGGRPLDALCGRSQPLVITLHGVAPMAIPLREYFPTWRKRVRGAYSNFRKRRAWRASQGQYASVITVSHYSKREIVRHLPIDPDMVFPCYNAVDHRVFRVGEKPPERTYLLHISNDEPRKNIDRICDAYLAIPEASRPPLLLKLPANNKRESHDGISVIRERLSDDALAGLYQGAIGFLFPSLFEGFGLPILEAMACGCPVITADDNACAEVGGDAALTVDPRSTDSIRLGIMDLLDREQLRRELTVKGVARAQQFSWQSAAECHLAVFRQAASTWAHRGD